MANSCPGGTHQTQIIVGRIPVGVLDGQLGLPDPTQPMHRTRLDHRPCLVGLLGPAGIGHHLALLGLVGPVGLVGVAAVGPAGALAGQPVAAVGPADDHPDPGGGLAGPASTVEFDHLVGAQDGVLLVAADPRIQLRR